MNEKPSIPKLAPRQRRQGAAATLDSANRKAMAERPSGEEEATGAIQPAEAVDTQPVAGKKARSKPAEAQAPRRAQGKVQIAVDIPQVLRGRARTAFKYAQFHGESASFSDFVASAIEEKVRQVERSYNGGKEFAVDEENLRSGRRTGS
jgi:hypothetical protein